jgi:hypothetical protein
MTTPTKGPAFRTGAAGTPINGLDANLAGGYIVNPLNAGVSLLVDPTGPASTVANGSTLAIPPGQPFYAIAGSTLPVSVVSTLDNHTFVSVQWK